MKNLKSAVIRQLGGQQAFAECFEDVCNHGAGAGFHGFIYSADTRAFYASNQAAIVALVEDMASDLGEEPMRLVQGFRCLGEDYTLGEIGRTLYGPKKNHAPEIANALAWFALEEVCRAEMDEREAA